MDRAALRRRREDQLVLFSGDQVASASIGADQTGQRTVDFTLDDQGKHQFANYTADHIGTILRDRPRRGGDQRAGDPGLDPQRPGPDHPRRHRRLPAADAQNLVTILEFGQLPFPIEELANTTVSPTLGEEFLRQSLLAA